MKKVLGLLISVFLFSGTVFADNIKIGVVDLQKIIQSSNDMKLIQEKLEKEFKSRRDQLVLSEAEIKRNMEKLARDNAVMSQSERKSLDKKIADGRATYEQEAQKYHQELNTAHNQAMEQFYSKIRTAISKIADRDKYDVVLQKDAAPFSSDKLDVTGKVMKEIVA